MSEKIKNKINSIFFFTKNKFGRVYLEYIHRDIIVGVGKF